MCLFLCLPFKYLSFLEIHISHFFLSWIISLNTLMNGFNPHRCTDGSQTPPVCMYHLQIHFVQNWTYHLPPHKSQICCCFCVHSLNGIIIYPATPARNLGVLMSLPSSAHSLTTSSFSVFWISLVFIYSLQLYYHCSSSSLIIFCLSYYNKTLTSLQQNFSFILPTTLLLA